MLDIHHLSTFSNFSHPNQNEVPSSVLLWCSLHHRRDAMSTWWGCGWSLCNGFGTTVCHLKFLDFLLCYLLKTWNLTSCSNYLSKTAGCGGSGRTLRASTSCILLAFSSFWFLRGISAAFAPHFWVCLHKYNWLDYKSTLWDCSTSGTWFHLHVLQKVRESSFTDSVS